MAVIRYAIRTEYGQRSVRQRYPNVFLYLFEHEHRPLLYEYTVPLVVPRYSHASGTPGQSQTYAVPSGV